MNKFLKVIKPAPILNIPNFRSVFGEKHLMEDEKGHIRAIEFIALKGMVFKIKKKLSILIYIT